MRITALAGGVGGARFLRGLRAHLDRTPDLADSTVTVIGNTGDDITLFGLRVCPDLDTVMYTLGGGIDEEQGWGRVDETHAVQQELAAYGAVAAVVRPRRPRLRHPRRPQPVLGQGYPAVGGHRRAWPRGGGCPTSASRCCR